MSYMSPNEGIPLDGLVGLPKPMIAKLKATAITTAEQLVAAVAASGQLSMAGHLGLSVQRFQTLLNAVEAAIPQAELARLKSPVRHQYGFGAILDDPPDEAAD